MRRANGWGRRGEWRGGGGGGLPRASGREVSKGTAGELEGWETSSRLVGVRVGPPGLLNSLRGRGRQRPLTTSLPAALPAERSSLRPAPRDVEEKTRSNERPSSRADGWRRGGSAESVREGGLEGDGGRAGGLGDKLPPRWRPRRSSRAAQQPPRTRPPAPLDDLPPGRSARRTLVPPPRTTRCRGEDEVKREAKFQSRRVAAGGGLPRASGREVSKGTAGELEGWETSSRLVGVRVGPPGLLNSLRGRGRQRPLTTSLPAALPARSSSPRPAPRDVEKKTCSNDRQGSRGDRAGASLAHLEGGRGIEGEGGDPVDDQG